MKPLLFGSICAALTLSGAAQAPQPPAIPPAMLNFEMQHSAALRQILGLQTPGDQIENMARP